MTKTLAITLTIAVLLGLGCSSAVTIDRTQIQDDLYKPTGNAGVGNAGVGGGGAGGAGAGGAGAGGAGDDDAGAVEDDAGAD